MSGERPRSWTRAARVNFPQKLLWFDRLDGKTALFTQNITGRDLRPYPQHTCYLHTNTFVQHDLSLTET